MNDRLAPYWIRLKRRAGSKPSPKDQPQPTPETEPNLELDPTIFVGDDAATNEQRVRDGFVSKARRFLRQLPAATDTVALYFCLLDRRTPAWVKGVAAAALAYFILPLDAVPDILPAIGLSDDAAVLTAAVTAVSAHVTEAHRARAASWMAEEHLEP